MAKYFKSIKSFEDLKNQFRSLARENHPDAGGDPEVMKAINLEYDQLFPVWKRLSGSKSSETADSTRREFYSSTGWKGANYSSRRPLRDVAAIVRAYVKEVYPQYKFSVTGSASYNRLRIMMTEAPREIYVNPSNRSRWSETYCRYNRDKYISEIDVMCEDIRDLVNSYNFEDIDAQVDYFRVGFWFHGVEIAGNLVINPKRASRKAKTRKVAC